jgi:hypothetical protein
MKEYFDFVEGLAKNKENKVFFNSGPIHASIVMSRIFEYAQSDVKIFCGGFSGAVSNDPLYLESLERFLKRENTSLKILVEDYETNKNSKIYSLLKKYTSKIAIFQTKERVVNAQNGHLIHFTIGDDKMLRLETNPNDFTAQVNFQSSDAKSISAIFDNLFGKSDSNTLISL